MMCEISLFLECTGMHQSINQSIMASTILYKFRSSTSFESIQMPGSSARLFDVKRAIVRAKHLDRANAMQLEFDLSVKNAMTGEEYEEEGMLLPRGTRVIVQRLPAAKGHGLLARIARADAGMDIGMMTSGSKGMGGGKGMGMGGGMANVNRLAADKGFYTIESVKNEDEFVSAAPVPVPVPLALALPLVCSTAVKPMIPEAWTALMPMPIFFLASVLSASMPLPVL
mmetsp:Transcript_17439/g.26364  ORF Transcript_17439/g.26364 Transcript_17439/m.26364 type:complete len:227 (-) Transcript_17439:2182-2862(-)